MAAAGVHVAEPHYDASLAEDGALAQECPRYVEMARRALALASGEGFSDVEALDIFRIAAQPDNGGRPVCVFLPAHLLPGDEQLLERATLYVLAKMHQLVVVEQREYTVLWLCNNRDTPSSLPLSWWRRTYWSVPYCFHERLHCLAVVHPSLQVRAVLFALSYLPRHSFWEKLDYADRLEFLDSHVPIELVKTLPAEVKQHDKDLDKEMYASVQGPRGPDGMPANMWASSALGGGLGAAGLGGAGFGAAGMGDEAMPNREKPVELPKRNWED